MSCHEQECSPAELIPPLKNIVFHVPPEASDSVAEDSAYQESDWESLVKRKWFWGSMNRGNCEIKLYNEGKMGDFILRLNSTQKLVMSFWYGAQI